MQRSMKTWPMLSQENRTIATDPEIIPMIKLVDKDIKKSIKNVFHMLEMVEESMSMIRGDKEAIKRARAKF